MALISEGLFLTVVVVDKGGNKSTMRFSLNSAAAAFADLEALGSAAGNTRILEILNDLGLVSQGRIIGYNIGESFKEDTNFFGPAGSEVEELALITGRINGVPNKSHTVRIPAPAATIFVNDAAPGPDANKIDPADPDLLSWMTHFQATVTDVSPFTGSFLVSDGEQLEDVTAATITGKRIHRGSTKG